jgi:DNA-binding NtrC family response regulator
MVTVHCAALSPTLLESELFGHEKGSFTGAHERRIGRFEQAAGGTLFLDEIGEIDASTQVKLLRFLSERTFERVGSNKTQTSDVRLLAATNRNLAAMVKAGTFREDLFFRLQGLEIKLPPLRERRSDIPLLVQSFAKETAKANDRPSRPLSPEAMDLLLSHRWPGNVRELYATIEAAVVLCRGDTITPRDLPANIRHPEEPGAAPETTAAPPIETVKEAEKQVIVRALREAEGNRTLAAQRIGISRRTLHRKLHQFGLEHL